MNAEDDGRNHPRGELGLTVMVAPSSPNQPRQLQPRKLLHLPRWQSDEGGATVCRVDRATYVGWRTFHGICHTCHSQDAVGSTFAPDLLVRMRTKCVQHVRGTCKDAVTYMELAVKEAPDNDYYKKQLERFQKILAEKGS